MSKESSSRKKKSRSQSASKKESASAYKTNDKENDPHLNFSAMIVGMVSTFIVVFGVFGLGAEAPPAPETNPTIIAREKQRKETKRQESLRDKINLLAKMKEARGSSLEQKMNLIEERIKISKEIVDLNPEVEADRQTGVSAHIVSHIQLLGLDFSYDLRIPGVFERLKRSYEPYLDDSNAKISSDAQIAQLTYKSVKKIRNEDMGSVSGIVEQFTRLMNRYPDNKFVASKIELHLQMLISHDQEYGERVFNEILKQSSAETVEEMEERFQSVSDFILLVKNDFEDCFADRNAKRELGRRNLIEACEKMLASKGVGISVIEKVAIVANWLEQTGRNEEANQIYDSVLASSEQGNLRERVVSRAVKLANAGKKRCVLTGEIVSFRGNDWLGEPLDDAELKEHVVAVVFWSRSHPASLRFLDELISNSRVLSNKPLVILAVCGDKEIDASLPIFEKKSSLIRVVKRLDSEGNVNSLYDLCPVDFWPHLLLIGYGGEIRNSNFEPIVTKLRDEVLRLIVEDS